MSCGDADTSVCLTTCHAVEETHNFRAPRALRARARSSGHYHPNQEVFRLLERACLPEAALLRNPDPSAAVSPLGVGSLSGDGPSARADSDDSRADPPPTVNPCRVIPSLPPHHPHRRGGLGLPGSVGSVGSVVETYPPDANAHSVAESKPSLLKLQTATHTLGHARGLRLPARSQLGVHARAHMSPADP